MNRWLGLLAGCLASVAITVAFHLNAGEAFLVGMLCGVGGQWVASAFNA